ncbi:hypothetical protein Tco_1330381 [Tanacetum coccineum]
MLVVAIPKLEGYTIPNLEGSGYIMESIHVEYEWKPPGCDECKIFGHLCDNFPKQSSTSKAQPKDEKQKDVQDVGLQSVKRKTSTCGNWKSQDNGNVMDDLVADTRKKVEVPSRKTSIWSGRKTEINITLSLKTEHYYFDRDALEFANMDQVVEEAEHENAPSEHGCVAFALRIILGPAGIVQAATLLKQKDILLGLNGAVISTQEYMKKFVEDVGEDEDFKSGSWVSATDYVNANGGSVSRCLGDIKNFLKNGKLDQVVAIASLVLRM